MEALAGGSIVGVILAGGRSQRMGGGDKGMRDLGGKPMLAHVLARISPQVDTIILSANGDSTRFARFALPVVSDPFPGFPGPLAGVLAGMRWATGANPPARSVLTVPSDSPFLPADLAERLAAASDAGSGRIAMAQSGGKLHPVIALWPTVLAQALETAIAAGERRVQRWAEQQGMTAVDFAPQHVNGHVIDPFFNANTPDDFREAERLMQLIEAESRGE